jgi:hypothetical protein
MRTMDGPVKWNTSASKQVPTLAHPKWRQVRQGLILALAGQPLTLVFGLAGLYLVAVPDGPLAARLNLPLEDASLVGWILVGGGLFGYLLLLAGVWRCLLFAPQSHGAKDLQFACLLCTLIVPVCFGLSLYFGSKPVYAAVQSGPGDLLRLELLRPGPLLHLAGLGCGLMGVLLFSAFARAVSRCLNDADATRTVTWYFWFVAFLMGATVGLILQAKRTTPYGMLPGLGTAWLLCLFWHALLIYGTVRRVGRTLRGWRPSLAPVPVADPGETPRRPGRVVLEAANYLRWD